MHIFFMVNRPKQLTFQYLKWESQTDFLAKQNNYECVQMRKSDFLVTSDFWSVNHLVPWHNWLLIAWNEISWQIGSIMWLFKTGKSDFSLGSMAEQLAFYCLNMKKAYFLAVIRPKQLTFLHFKLRLCSGWQQICLIVLTR